MTSRHYHIGSNMSGYMPESDIYTVSSKREAISLSYSDARENLEFEREGTSYLPKSEQPKWFMRGSAGNYIVDNDDWHHLSTRFWVNGPCYCDDVEDSES